MERHIDSRLIKDVNKMLKHCYGFEDIVKNDVDAIIARIQFVKKNEERC